MDEYSLEDICYPTAEAAHHGEDPLDDTRALGNQEAFQAVRRLNPQAKASIKAKYELFGGRDALVVYDAPTGEAAMEFLTGNLCKLTGVTDTETFAAVVLE